jgi:hypothetical protein
MNVIALAAAALLGQTPLIDMAPGQAYLGQFAGGLYPACSNVVPKSHVAAAPEIVPINGRIVMISLGMSNTTQEWCCKRNTDPPTAWSYMGKPMPLGLKVLNGARAGQAADGWDEPSDSNWGRVKTQILQPAGVAESDIQVVWLKVANKQSGTRPSLPALDADAYVLAKALGDILRTMKQKWPNVKRVYLSSRIYGGYAQPGTNSPEPYAYEGGFAVKWVVAAQIAELEGGPPDELIGSLSLDKSPWIAWGPYLWANAEQPRSDGLRWLPGDLEADGTHPSKSGETKVADRLDQFFRSQPWWPQ